MTPAERSKALRYKRPALASMGYDSIMSELWEIQEACSDVQWFMGQDGDTLLAALDGNEDDAWEFKMAFTDLANSADQLINAMNEYVVQNEFDDCTVALIGNRYRMVGFDSMEEDYFGLTGFEEHLAETDAGKRLMRHTKVEMISTIGQCFGTLIAYLDLRQKYDYLKATMDILRGENLSILQVVREIEDAYEAAVDPEGVFRPDNENLIDKLTRDLPERLWIE